MNVEPEEPSKIVTEPPKIVTLQVPETTTQKKTTKKPKAAAASQPKVKILEINDLADLDVFQKEKSPTNEDIQTSTQIIEEEPPGIEEFETEKGQFTDETINLPEWAKEANIKDSQGRRPDEEGYDPTTLYIPPKALDKMGKTVKKYWEVKSQHYDKVVFVRFGKTYCAYHRDAIICHTLIGSSLYNRHGSSTIFVYPNKIIKYCQRLLDIDYKSVLVEPVPVKTEDDKEESELQIFQVITKGTYVEPNPENLTPRYCLFLTENNQEWGFTYVDTTTHEFFMGEFKETPNRTRLKSLLLRVKPVEIAFRDREMNREIVTMMKNLHWKPTITPLSLLKPMNLKVIIGKFERYLAENGHHENFKVIKELIENKENPASSWILQGLYLALEYLEFLCLADTVFKKGRFMFDEYKKDTGESLLLDGQTIYNLELLDVSYRGSNTEQNLSLLQYLDKTSTPFGKRMLQRWLIAPLRDREKINERLDAVEDLLENMGLCESLQARLKKLPDLERMVHSIYNFGSRFIFHMLDFEAYVKPKLALFAEILKQFREVDQIVKSFIGKISKFKSKRLARLLTYSTENGLFPALEELLKEMESMITIRNKNPVPAAGLDPEYDRLSNEADEIENQLQEYLVNIRKTFKTEAINYAHIKHRYELEFPEHIIEGNKRPKEFQLTSKKKGYLRFHTPEIQDLTWKLYEIEYDMNRSILPYLVKCFKRFYDHSTEWQQIVTCLGELDCLISLAKVAKVMDIACKPEIVAGTGLLAQEFELKGMVHPCMAYKYKEDFVRNDVIQEKDQRVFLITGPNMGGKSTLMRSACVLTIMAQMGSFVPAESFKLSLKDRIFTRIGASDNLFEGKSTFFVELEETYNIVNEATEDSLVIMDELGRGTSTYDGFSIAYAVVKYLAQDVKCVSFFATHYHLLVEEFQFWKEVCMYYMDYEVISEEMVRFLYKFRKGAIERSFGLSVARIAGLEDSVIEKAREKSDMMIAELAGSQKNRKVVREFQKDMELLIENEKGGISEEEVLQRLFGNEN